MSLNVTLEETSGDSVLVMFSSVCVTIPNTDAETVAVELTLSVVEAILDAENTSV